MWTALVCFVLFGALVAILAGRGGSPNYTPGDPMNPAPGQPFESGGVRMLVILGAMGAIAACILLSQMAAPGGSLIP